jgi:histidyl-tRNA synthetase
VAYCREYLTFYIHPSSLILSPVTSPQRIPPRVLKGFRDDPPEMMIPRERLIDCVRRIYRSYGYAPIDTPALEYLEILTGKAGEESEKQLYKFEDQGGRWVGLRFDLTVPFARFAAQYVPEAGIPFKRYHIAKVWRGENTARGRFREFMQCDFDIIGTRSVAADVEIVLVIHDLLQAIGLSEFSLRLNNRRVLTGMLEGMGIQDQAVQVLRALDKFSKIGRDAVTEEMLATGRLGGEQAAEILRLAELAGSNAEILKEAEPFVAKSPAGQEGLARLKEVLDGACAAGVPESRLQIDLSIARGLDYYTGMVYETYLTALPGIGSVCSGGRYDNLAGLFTAQELPGVGASLGLDRLLAAMQELNLIEKVGTPAEVLIPYFDPDRLSDYLKLAAAIRAAGFSVEVYPEPKKLGQQLKYADRRGHRVALIAGAKEFAAGSCQVKDLQKTIQRDVPLEPDAQSVIVAVKEILK